MARKKMKETQKRSRKKEGGFTLAEVMMASGLFALLSLAVFSAISSSNTILQMQTLNAEINQDGLQMLRSISREIAESNPVDPVLTFGITPNPYQHLILTEDAELNDTTPPGHNNTVTFQVPVDWDNDGDVVQSSLTQTVEWGAYRFVRGTQQQSWLNGWARYRVVDDQLLREVLDPSRDTVLATDVIVPQDVLAFQMTLVNRRVSIILTIKKTDVIGQKGDDARTYQTTFDGETLLRNGG